VRNEKQLERREQMLDRMEKEKANWAKLKTNNSP